MRTTIYYLVKNQSDGSVFVKFYESRQLAELLDSFEDERFEDAVGPLYIKHDGIIQHK